MPEKSKGYPSLSQPGQASEPTIADLNREAFEGYQRVPMGGVSQERLGQIRENSNPWEGTTPASPLSGDLREMPGWEQLNNFEKWAVWNMRSGSTWIGRISDTVKQRIGADEAMAAAGSSPLVSLPLKIVGAGLQILFDLGAEVPERLMGMKAQYDEARRSGTMDEFTSNLGSAWRAASFHYNVTGFQAFAPVQWEDNYGNALSNGMPGASELAKIRRMYSEGATPEEVEVSLMEDQGALYYRGLMADLALHMVFDASWILGSLKLPTRVARARASLLTGKVAPDDIAHWTDELNSARRVMETLQEEKRAVMTELGALRAQAGEAFAAGRAGEGLGIGLRADEFAAQNAKRVLEIETALQRKTDDVIRLTNYLKEAEAPSYLADRLIRFTGGYPIRLAEGADEISDLGGAVLWKPWTWFQLTPRSKAMEFIHRTADHAKVLIRNIEDPEVVVALLRNPLRALESTPQLGRSILSLEGRSLRTALKGSEVRLSQLIDAWRGTADLRDNLRAMAGLSDTDLHKFLSGLADVTDAEVATRIAQRIRNLPEDELVGAQRALAALDESALVQEVKKIREMFLDGQIPYDMDTFRLHAIGEVMEGAAQQAVLQFGVNTEKWFTKASNALKSAESLAFLRLNPGYPVRNFLNNEITMWARGVWSAMSEEAILKYWERIGFTPERLGAGFGPAEDALRELAQGTFATKKAARIIADAVRGKGNFADNVADWFSNIKLGKLDGGYWAQVMEARASRRAYTKGFMDFIADNWSPRKGFDTLEDYVARHYPGVDIGEFGPNFTRRVHAGIKDSMNAGEIDNLFVRDVDISINRAIDGLAEDMGRTPEEVRDILTEPLLANLQRDLTAAAGDREAISAAFRAAEKNVQEYLDRAITNELNDLAERAAARIKAGGDPTQYIGLVREQMDELHGYMDGYLSRLQGRAEAIRRLPPERRGAAWKAFLAENDQYFRHVYGRAKARYQGMVRAAQRYGVPVPDNSVRAMDEFTEAVTQFHRTKQQLYNSYFSKKKPSNTDWQRLNGQLDQAYTQLMKDTLRTSRKMDDPLYRVMQATRPHFMPEVRAWRETVHEVRQLYMNDVRSFYREMEFIDDAAERAVRYAEFNEKRIWWMNRIHLAEREGLEVLRTGKPFGTIGDLDDDLIRIYNSKSGFNRLFQNEGGIEARVQELMQEGAITESFARKMAQAEAQDLAQSLGGRMEDRLIQLPNPDRFQNANIILRDAEVAGASVADTIPRATRSIAGTEHRLTWLRELALESTDEAVVAGARQEIGRIWRDLPVDEIAPALETGDYAMLTAFDEALTPDELQGAMSRMRQEMVDMGYDPITVQGRYGGQDEPSFLVPGMTQQDAYYLGRKYGQDSVFASGEGLIYTSTDRPQVNPASFEGIQVNDLGRVGAEAPPNQELVDAINARILNGDLTADQIDDVLEDPRKLYDWFEDNPLVAARDEGDPELIAQAQDWIDNNPNTPTAGFRDARVDPEEALRFPGARDEHLNIDQARVDELADSIRADGFRPDSKPLIVVEQDGTIQIYEGNHRIRAAIKAGVDEIPVTVRYMGGSETIDGVWMPTLPGVEDNFTRMVTGDGRVVQFSIDVNFDRTLTWRAPMDGPGGMVSMVRYSDPGLGLLSPHDARSLTGVAGAEARRRLNYGDDFVPRLHYYLDGTPAEKAVATANRQAYRVQVPKERIYDWARDPDNLRVINPGGANVVDVTLTEKAIKEAGYLGYRNTASDAPNTVVIFEDLVPHDTPPRYGRLLQRDPEISDTIMRIYHERTAARSDLLGRLEAGEITEEFARPRIEQLEKRITFLEERYPGISEALENELTAALGGPRPPSGADAAASMAPGYTRAENQLVTEDWLRSKFQVHFNLDEEELNAVMAVARARARSWSHHNQQPMDAYYHEKFAAVITDQDPGASAFVEFLDDGRAVIGAANNPDISSLMHELGHVFRRDLGGEDMAILRSWWDGAASNQVSKRVQGAIDINPGIGPEDARRIAEEEVFADAFVNYLRTGKAPVEELKPVFERFKDWLSEIYKSLRNADDIDIDIPDEIEDLFNRLLGSDLPAETPGIPNPGVRATVMDEFLPDSEPLAAGLDELWWRDGSVLMGRMQERALAQLDEAPLRADNLSDGAQAALRGYMAHVKGQQNDTILTAQRFGEIKRDAALLNYTHRTHFDHGVGHVAPFAFWTTHSAWNWILWSAEKPQIMATFMRMRRFQDRMADARMPTRFQGFMRTPLARLPFVPDWMGPIYTNPLAVGLPFDLWSSPYDRLQDHGYSVVGRADAILRRMVEEGQITELDYQQAIQNRDGELWSSALQEAQETTETVDTYDAFSALIAPHAPLAWLWHKSRGHPEKIGPFLPATRTIKGLTALLGIGGNGGFNPEAGLRGMLGLPEFDEWDDYRAERMIANMVATGEVDVTTGRRAMIEHSGPVWDLAVKRAGEEYGVLALGSLLGVPLKAYPPGEERSRELVGEMYELYEEGNQKKIDRFWQENPEVKARLALFDEPEERMSRFLADEIWDKWSNLTSLEKRSVAESLGPEFEERFLNKETRNITGIDPNLMGVWLKLMGGDPPGTLVAPSGAPSYIQMPPPEIAQRAEAYYGERRQRFGDAIWEVQDRYFDLAKGDARRQYLRDHPELKAYWDWRNSWLARNPSVAPYLTEDFEPDYRSVQEMEQAYEQEPTLTWSEWQFVMPDDLFLLMSHHLATGDPLYGPEFRELEQVATELEITVDELLFRLGEAWANQ